MMSETDIMGTIHCPATGIRCESPTQNRTRARPVGHETGILRSLSDIPLLTFCMTVFGQPENPPSVWLRAAKSPSVSIDARLRESLRITLAQPGSSGSGRSPFRRTGCGQLSVSSSYLTLALSASAGVFFAAAAMAEGSAKAITASPSSKLEPGLPPKP
jgi:hypothetical protein